MSADRHRGGAIFGTAKDSPDEFTLLEFHSCQHLKDISPPAQRRHFKSEKGELKQQAANFRRDMLRSYISMMCSSSLTVELLDSSDLDDLAIKVVSLHYVQYIIFH